MSVLWMVRFSPAADWRDNKALADWRTRHSTHWRKVRLLALQLVAAICSARYEGELFLVLYIIQTQIAQKAAF